jgi:hypothetical protein
MVLLLNSTNVFDYLTEQGLFPAMEKALGKVELLEAKNFNLLVTLANGSQLLVKQERHREGKAIGEFVGEWQIKILIDQFSELREFESFLPEMLRFDRDNSILIFRYLDEYQDLSNFHQKEKLFPPQIASSIGSALGTLHRQTFKNQSYQDFLIQEDKSLSVSQITNMIQGLERITPEIFGSVPDDGLKFFALYQRYDSLGQSIAKLTSIFEASCLTHNDLKLNNILLHNKWQSEASSLIRLIDLERASWGDPAYDLGMLIASYLQLWLGNLVVNKSLSIEESLRLAIIPLEKIQPSLAALMEAYLAIFPQILVERPDFLGQVIQFTGFALIQQILAMIQYQKSFGNHGIVILQVAKKLLGYPHQSMATIFGTSTIYAG